MNIAINISALNFLGTEHFCWLNMAAVGAYLVLVMITWRGMDILVRILRLLLGQKLPA